MDVNAQIGGPDPVLLAGFESLVATACAFCSCLADALPVLVISLIISILLLGRHRNAISENHRSLALLLCEPFREIGAVVTELEQAAYAVWRFHQFRKPARACFDLLPELPELGIVRFGAVPEGTHQVVLL
jgi:hypothetical protein